MTIPDLWDRLVRLEAWCEITITTRFDPGQPIGWVVDIVRRDNREQPVRAEGRHLLEALSDALAQADGLGWIPPLKETRS